MEMTAREVDVWTDGSFDQHGRGGWGAVVLVDDRMLDISGGTTQAFDNNDLELMAVVEALRRIPRPARVRVHTDSRYVEQAINDPALMVGRTDLPGRPSTQGLWRHLLILCSALDVQARWVKGHSGHPANERADRLATQGRRHGELQAQLLPAALLAKPTAQTQRRARRSRRPRRR